VGVYSIDFYFTFFLVEIHFSLFLLFSYPPCCRAYSQLLLSFYWGVLFGTKWLAGARISYRDGWNENGQGCTVFN